MQGTAARGTASSSVPITLEALSSNGKRLSATDTMSQESFLEADAPQLLTATKISLHQVQKPYLRARVRDVMSNNIARRTLKTTIVFGTLTMIYYVTSLVPAFQAADAAVRTMEMQSQSGDDSSQLLAFGFLKECNNRKVSSVTLLWDLFSPHSPFSLSSLASLHLLNRN
jgi:hypothetical protein